MARSCTSVYIGESAIRALELHGKRPHRWGMVPLEEGAVRDGVILDEEAVVGKLRDMWISQQVGSRRVVAGISGINCLYRVLTFPELPDSLLPEAVNREAARTLGIPMDQVYVSWQRIGSRGEEARVYLAAAPRNAVDRLIRTLRRAGLNPAIMDLRPLAIARTTTEQNALLLDLQPASLDIVVRMDGNPAVVRSVSLPREDPLEEKVPIIREELRRAVTFFNASHPEQPVGPDVPLLVSGELADQEEAWPRIAGGETRPVKPLPPPVDTPRDFPAHEYTANIGLAFKETLSQRELRAYSPVDFNALPEQYRPKPTPVSQILYLPAVIAGVALVALAAYLTIPQLDQTEELRSQLAQTNRTVVELTAQVKDRQVTLEEEIAGLEDEVAAAEQKYEKTTSALSSTREGMISTRHMVNADLATINDGLGGEGIHLSSLNHGLGSVQLSGAGDNEYDVFTYATFLRASGRFQPVVITDMSRSGERISYAIFLGKE
ncbi:MAG: pilus assembly protein PilM [Chloroflexota bacterium]